MSAQLVTEGAQVMRNRSFLAALMLLFVLSVTACHPKSSAKQNPPGSSGSTSSTATCTIPQNNGGDHDADNNGGPDDGDGCDK
jgi:hypothetical protein